MAKDFVGNEFDIGDTVVYASTVGRSAKLTRGVVVGFKGGGVQIRRTETSWGGKVGKETRYIDSRTGKGIDPSFAKHQERPYGYVNKNTGEFLTFEGRRRLEILNYDDVYDDKGYVRRNGSSYYGGSWGSQLVKEQVNPDYVHADWQYTSPVYKDYVTEVEKESRAVNVGLGNILKVAPSE